MRRGLIVRSRTELPDTTLAARIALVRTAMAQEQLDALLVYTNNTQTAGVSWLTGFVPYWSEALLVLPRDGAVRLVAALSFRVKSWIERTSRLDEVIHTPRIGLEAGRIIAALKSDAVVGIVDFDNLMSGIADDLRAGGPAIKLSDASSLFTRVRGTADRDEIALATKATRVAELALAAVPRGEDNLGEIIASVEGVARRAGAEEVYMASAPDLARDQRLLRHEGEARVGEHFALRVTIAYMGTWIRLGRTFARNGEWANVIKAEKQFRDAMTELPDTKAFRRFRYWLMEGCLTTQPLAPLAGTRVPVECEVPAGAVVSIQARINVDGRPIFLSEPILIAANGAGTKSLSKIAAPTA